MINVFFEDVEPFVINKKELDDWLFFVCEKEGLEKGDINLVFCSDEYLLEINKKHLGHDYYTDIITFDYSDENKVSGDLFISIERVKDNSKAQKTKEAEELLRIVVHGVLHLLGYKDKTPQEKEEMREKEDFYLKNVSRGT